MPEFAGASESQPEPVIAEAIRPVSRPLLTMQWRDLAFLHWPVDTGAAARLMPPGTRPDLFHGVSFAGVIAFRMHDVGVPGLPTLPYLGSFPETNVRLYSVGPTAGGEWCSVPWTRPGCCRLCSAGRPSGFLPCRLPVAPVAGARSWSRNWAAQALSARPSG